MSLFQAHHDTRTCHQQVIPPTAPVGVGWLLHLLVNPNGQVLPHQQILRTIWGPGKQDATHYLRVLVGQLRQKLGEDPTRPRFIMTVQGVGYRLATND